MSELEALAARISELEQAEKSRVELCVTIVNKLNELRGIISVAGQLHDLMKARSDVMVQRIEALEYVVTQLTNKEQVN